MKCLTKALQEIMAMAPPEPGQDELLIDIHGVEVPDDLRPPWSHKGGTAAF